MNQQLITHRKAAEKLHSSIVRIEEGIRRGIVPFADYQVVADDTPSRTETWYLTPDQVEETGRILLKAERHSELPSPEEAHLGVQQRLYNWSLRTARLRAGLTQAQLGKRIGMSSSKISQFESLREYPSESQAQAIINVLGVATDILFPAWLEEFRLERSPSILTDAHFSIEDALEAGISLPSLPGPEAEAEQELLKEALRDILPTLSEREARVLQLRFGLEDGEKHTLEEVAPYFNVTREAIRAIEAKALRKLRHPSRSEKLRDFLD